MKKRNILIDGFINSEAVQFLKKYTNIINIKENDKNNLLKKINIADGIVLKTTKLTNEDLDKAKKLKVISRFGVGYDNLDLKYLKKKKFL